MELVKFFKSVLYVWGVNLFCLSEINTFVVVLFVYSWSSGFFRKYVAGITRRFVVYIQLVKHWACLVCCMKIEVCCYNQVVWLSISYMLCLWVSQVYPLRQDLVAENSSLEEARNKWLYTYLTLLCITLCKLVRECSFEMISCLLKCWSSLISLNSCWK